MVVKLFFSPFRFGHSQVNTHLWRFEEDGTVSHYGHIPLRDVFFSPERVGREGGIDSLLRGAVKQVAQEVDLKVWNPISIYSNLLQICSVWIFQALICLFQFNTCIAILSSYILAFLSCSTEAGLRIIRFLSISRSQF